MASIPYSQRTQVTPAPEMIIPVTDPNAGTGLKNVAITLQALLEQLAAAQSGSQIYTGAASPSELLGNNGDYFINTESGALFGPKAEGLWPTTPIALTSAADATLEASIAAEITTRQEGDAGNAAAISAEATARAAGDTTNANAISAEVTARAAGDTTNANAISAEATARAAGDTTNANAISAEVTRAMAAEAAEAATRATAVAGMLAKANNLADLASATTARTNLGLTALATAVLGAGLLLSGGALAANFGTTTGTVADGGVLAAVQATANAALPSSAVGATVAPLVGGTVPLSYMSPGILGAPHYVGTWNAASNSPALSSGTAPTGPQPTGSYYIVGTSGSTALNGISTWNVGDWVLWSGTAWQKLDGQANPVSAVAGYQGSVTAGQLATALALSAPATAPFGTTVGTVADGGATVTALAGKQATLAAGTAGQFYTASGTAGAPGLVSGNAAGGPLVLDSGSRVAGQFFGANGSAASNNAALQAYPYAALADGQFIQVLYAVNPGDGGARLVQWQAGSTASADGVFVVNPTGHTGQGRFVTCLSGAYRVDWWGCNGAADASVGINAAQAVVAANGGGALEYSAATYLISNPIVPLAGVVHKGAHKYTTTVKVSAQIGAVSSASHIPGNVVFQDMTFWGYGDRIASQGTNSTFAIVATGNIYLYRVQVKYSEKISIFIGAYYGHAEDCEIYYGYRDGINFSSGSGCTISKAVNNIVQYCGDDGICSHENPTSTATVFDKEIVFTGNSLSFCNGMKALGARRTIMTGNNLRFVYGYGVSLGIDTNAVEGYDTMFNVDVSNNTFTDLINLYYVTGGAENQCVGIYVNGALSLGTAPTAAAVFPGQYNSATSAFITPDAYENYSGTGVPRGNNRNITLSNNKFEQTLSGCSYFADAGFGELWFTSGFVNPSFSSNIALKGGGYGMTAISLNGGGYDNVKMNGNTICGAQAALLLNNVAYLNNSEFCSNIVQRCVQGIASAQSAATSVDLRVYDCDFDLDTYCEATGGFGRVSASSGQWSALGGSNYIAIATFYTQGMDIRRCSFKNCLANIYGRAGDIYTAQQNKLFVDWSVSSPSYAGVGFPVVNTGDLVYFMGSIPSASNYGLFNSPADSGFVTKATAQPTSGYYFVGQTILNSAPAISGQQLIYGWYRLTSSNNNVAGTDWAQLTFLVTGGTLSGNLTLQGTGNGLVVSNNASIGNNLSAGNQITATHGIGAFGVTPPTSKPSISGSRSGATATVLEALLQAVQSYGLITDSTTS